MEIEENNCLICNTYQVLTLNSYEDKELTFCSYHRQALRDGTLLMNRSLFNHNIPIRNTNVICIQCDSQKFITSQTFIIDYKDNVKVYNSCDYCYNNRFVKIMKYEN